MNRPHKDDSWPKQEHGGDVYSLARSLGWPEDRIIDFSANINPLGISPRAQQAIQAALKGLDRYPDPQVARLKDCLADYHHLSAQSFLVGNGATELIHLLPRVLKPKNALILVPAFSEYERASRLAGAAIHRVGLNVRDGFRINVETVAQKCSKGIDLLFLCNPNNPTGRLLAREEIVWLVKKVARCSTWVVVDEAFIDYAPDQSVLSCPQNLVDHSSNLIVLRSFTKFFALSGLRVGYLSTQSALVKKLQIAKDPWSVNTLAQIAARESLLDVEYIKESLRFMETEKPRFLSLLDRIPGIQIFPSQANFVLIRVAKRGATAYRLFGSLARTGILVRGCESFGGLGPGFLRVAVKRREENDRLAQALRTALSHGLTA